MAQKGSSRIDEMAREGNGHIDNLANEEIRDKISGCLFGGALGDALGYAVEFSLYPEIVKYFGKDGIQDLQLMDEKAVFSDDTQMTLFTLEGMVQGANRAMARGISADVEWYVYLSYLKWVQTQWIELSFPIPYDWPSELAKVPEMNHRRAPGNTCLSALMSGSKGTMEQPLNHSRGCGGVMRTAPLGFIKNWGMPLLNGARVAAITHGHPLGWLPAGMLSDIIYKIIYEERKPLKEIIAASLKDTLDAFSDCPDIGAFEGIIKKAMALSETDGNDVSVIEEIGGGWVGDEALAIAVYCCLKYPDNLRKMLTVSVNHSGDSDSTGAIAGNILGAYLGMDAIPRDWLEKLEMTDVIRRQVDRAMSVIDAC